MTKTKFLNRLIKFSIITIVLFISGCERDIDILEPAAFPTTANVFIDGFSAGLNYAAFGGSRVDAFQVVTDEKFKGTQSMRIAVPNAGDPKGAYAGGAYFTSAGRDLTGYDALTFYAKASKGATIDVLGFGNDLAANNFVATVTGLKVSTIWEKYIIPIPLASKLTEERGMFFFSEGPENDFGYNIWFDEVKFEKLGTLAHPKPAILETQDQTFSAQVGANLPLGGTFVSYNLPDGTDQRVEAAPGYFTFVSSDENVATVDEKGVVSTVGLGTTVITAKLGEIDAAGSFTVNVEDAPAAPTVAAPTPTQDAANVISLFSNAYTDVPIDTWSAEWDVADLVDLQIAGNDVKFYSGLSFAGIEFLSNKIDASSMTHFHMDIWTPDNTTPPAAFKIKLVDFGADGAFGGGDDSEHEISLDANTTPAIASEQWVGLDIPLTDFVNLTNRGNLAQLIISGDPNNVYVDNIYFYGDSGGGGGATEPTEPAPTPTQDAANVVSIFSDAYTDLEGTEFNPDWGQSTAVTTEDIQGNAAMKYANFNYQGIQLAANQDLSSMEYLHIDMWTSDATVVKVTPINASGAPLEFLVSMEPITAGQWNSYDIPLTEFTNSGMTLNEVMQMKFDGQEGTTPSNIYIDNIYFYGSGGGGGTPTEPTEPAPTPTQDAADVVSLFSDAYTDLEGTDFNPNWGQSTAVTNVDIQGNAAMKYADFNFQGIQLAANQDLSNMEYLHIDMWTVDATVVKVTPINASGAPLEFLVSMEPITAGQWNSYDIPLTEFTNSGMTLNEVMQMKFDGQEGTTPSNIYIDNIYFYGSGGGGGTPTEPTEPAPIPTQDAADVVSIFSDSYTDLDGTDFFPNWGQSTAVTTVDIQGNSAMKYADFNYQGIQLAANQDLSNMEYLHIDMWTVDATVVKVTPINASGAPLEFLVSMEPITLGQWSSYDIPLTEFTNSGMTLNEVMQMKFDGQEGTTPSNIYIDNIYFY